jgi:excisionase family DNA binding protein
MKDTPTESQLDAYSVSGSSPPVVPGEQRAVVTGHEREVRELLLQVVMPSGGSRVPLAVPDSSSVGASVAESGVSEWLTVEEFAASRGLHHQTVRKAIKDGRLSAEDWGAGAKPLYRIHRDAVVAPVARSRVVASIPARKAPRASAGRFSSLVVSAPTAAGVRP